LPFELKITAANAQELAEQAFALGALLSSEARPAAQSVTAESVELAEKPKRSPVRPKKGVTIEGEKTETDDVRGATGPGAGVEDGIAVGGDAGGAGRVGQVADADDGPGTGGGAIADQAAQDDEPAEVDAVAAADEGASAAAAEPEVTYDSMRKHVTYEINDTFDNQVDRAGFFRKFLDEFGVNATAGKKPLGKLAEIPTDQLGAAKAFFDAMVADTKKAAA